MSEIVQFKKNRLQTVVTNGAAPAPAVGYQFRMGYVADSDSHFQGVHSTFMMSQKVGANTFGVQFDNYKTTNNTAEINYITTMGTKNILNLFTISSVANGIKPVSVANTDFVRTDSISSGNVYARDIFTSNFTASNIIADAITARLINVQYVSSMQMSTTAIAGNSVSTGTLTFTTGFGTGTLNQNTAIVQSMTSIANNLSNVFGSTMTFTNTANLNDLNVATVNTSNFIVTPLIRATTVSSGTLSYNFAHGNNLSSQNVSTNTLGFVTANGTTVNLGGSLSAPTVNAVTVSSGTTTYAMAIGGSISTQSLSTNTFGFVTANGTTVNLGGSLSAPSVNVVTASTGTTTYALAIGQSISTQSLSTNTLGFVSANGGSLNVVNTTVSQHTTLSSATAKTIVTDALTVNANAILSTAIISTLNVNYATAEGISTNTLSSGSIVAGSVLANTFATSTLNAYNLNLASSINFLNAGAISALGEYNGMRVTDPASGHELGFFIRSDATGVDTQIAAINPAGTTSITLIQYMSTLTSTRVVSYLTEISSLTGLLSYGNGTLIGRAISTAIISTGQANAGTLNALSVNTLILSTGVAQIGTIISENLTNGLITSQTGISTNNLSSGSSYLGKVDINAAFSMGISTIFLSSGQSYFGNAFTANGTVTNLSTTQGTILNFAATTGVITNGTITNLSTTQGTIVNFAATTGVITNGTITNLSTTQGTIVNLAGTNGAITNLSTTQGTIVNLAATTGVITNGTITNLSTTQGTIVNLAATTARFTNLSTTNAAIVTGHVSNYFGYDITLSNKFVGPYLSTIDIYGSNAVFTTGLVNDLTASNITTTSDMRLKKNVMPLSNALHTVLQLEPVSYDWTTRGNMRNGYQEIGFIAQAVEAILPNIVSIRDDEINTRSLGYDRLTAVLTGAVKELATRVSALEARVQ